MKPQHYGMQSVTFWLLKNIQGFFHFMPVALCLEFYIWGLKFLWMPLRNILRTILNGRIPRLSMKRCFIRIGVWSDGPKDSLFGKMFVDSNQNIVVIIMQELHWSRFMCEELWQAKTVFAWLLFCWVCMQQKYYSGLRNNVGMSNVDTMDTFTFLSLSKHKANTTELHPEVRPTFFIFILWKFPLTPLFD